MISKQAINVSFFFLFLLIPLQPMWTNFSGYRMSTNIHRLINSDLLFTVTKFLFDSTCSTSTTVYLSKNSNHFFSQFLFLFLLFFPSFLYKRKKNHQMQLRFAVLHTGVGIAYPTCRKKINRKEFCFSTYLLLQVVFFKGKKISIVFKLILKDAKISWLF